MQFDIQDGKATGEQWRWLTYREGEEEMRMHVYVPDSTEWNRFVGRYRLGTPRGDWGGAQGFVSKKWFDDFEGAKDAKGDELPNDEPIRRLLLKKKKLWDWIFQSLAEAQEDIEEGN